LKEYIIQFKPFLVFLAKFFGTYLLLTFVYQSYLNQFDAKKFEVDSITSIVAEQSRFVLSIFDDNSYTMPNPTESSVKLFYHGKWIARIIEGCNAVSVMILFVSFVIAFSGKIKHTILFIISGCFIVHFFNVLRIALLSVSIFFYPEYEHILHGVIFPLIIYGIVFLLWVVWVNKFSTYVKNDTKK
jgi:exosortase family protein XrtF